ncbi:unnamed protein product [Cylicocyclus nassatus]|uniref:C2H2-type domain-containing protein n=1 Tax=Cylicocyclus nassatus TaxID=53992 RepID=A0AA36M3D0_CYLNA|nr:unnamed protein product [Cylicocyclus nassatus]
MSTKERCSLCGGGPFFPSHLREHLRRVHHHEKGTDEKNNETLDNMQLSGKIDHVYTLYTTKQQQDLQRINASILNAIMASKPTPNMACPTCAQEFLNKSDLALHYIESHNREYSLPIEREMGFNARMQSSLTNTNQQVNADVDESKREVHANDLLGCEQGADESMGDGGQNDATQEFQNHETMPKTVVNAGSRKIIKVFKGPEIRMRTVLETPEERARRLQQEVERNQRLQQELERNRSVVESEEERAARLRRNAERSKMRLSEDGQERERKRERLEYDEQQQGTRKKSEILKSSTLFSAISAEMINVKDFVASEHSASANKGPLCYAIVGINSVAQRTIFSRLMRRFEFDDIGFVSNPAAEKTTASVTEGTLSACSLQKAETALPYDDDVIMLDSGDDDDSVVSRPSTSQQHKSVPKADGENVSREQRDSPYGSNTNMPRYQRQHLPQASERFMQSLPDANEPVQSSTGKNAQRSSAHRYMAHVETSKFRPRGTKYTCHICSAMRAPHEIRYSSRKMHQNIVLLTCMKALKLISSISARCMYKDILRNRKRICHEHYVQAASFIAKYVQNMWQQFPYEGIGAMPRNLKENLLTYIQVNEDIDTDVTLSFNDIAQFFHDCLAKYREEETGIWSVDEYYRKIAAKEGMMRMLKIAEEDDNGCEGQSEDYSYLKSYGHLDGGDLGEERQAHGEESGFNMNCGQSEKIRQEEVNDFAEFEKTLQRRNDTNKWLAFSDTLCAMIKEFKRCTKGLVAMGGSKKHLHNIHIDMVLAIEEQCLRDGHTAHEKNILIHSLADYCGIQRSTLSDRCSKRKVERLHGAPNLLESLEGRRSAFRSIVAPAPETSRPSACEMSSTSRAPTVAASLETSIAPVASSSSEGRIIDADALIKQEESVENDKNKVSEENDTLFKEAKEESKHGEAAAMELLEPKAADSIPAPTQPPPLPPSNSQVLNEAAANSRGSSSSLVVAKTEASDKSTFDVSETLREYQAWLESLDGDIFRERFRMTKKTFRALCKALHPLMLKKAVRVVDTTAARIGVALEILAGRNERTILCGSKESAMVSDIFSDTLEVLLEWSSAMIQWPDEKSCERISDSFFEIIGMPNIVGCIDGTIVNGSQSINVGVVADDTKLFRWVFAKFRSTVNDETVFNKSLLCQHLREGVKKGRLIGDDAYESKPFLLTPNMGKDHLTVEVSALHIHLRRAHELVKEAIADWKRQFPILDTDIKWSSPARIIVSCAALYNLARNMGEPPFVDEESAVKCEPMD